MSSTAPKRTTEITQEQFDLLLGWLSGDRDRAGVIYENIRTKLIRIFVCRGSPIPEELTDRTINRVAAKLPEIMPGYVGNPANYFSGVAHNIFLESQRRDYGAVPLTDLPAASRDLDERTEHGYNCLEGCVEKLPSQDRHLVIDYYQKEKHAKIDHRQKMAQELGIGINALRIRACRIRAVLLKCVENCLGTNS